MTPLHGCLQFRGDYFLYGPLVGNSCGGLTLFSRERKKRGKRGYRENAGNFILSECNNPRL